MAYQDTNAVTSFLSSIIQSFLARHGFSSQNQLDGAAIRADASPSPRKRRKFMPTEDSGYAEVDEDSVHQTPPPWDDTDIVNFQAPPLNILDVNAMLSMMSNFAHYLQDDDLFEGDEIIWTDPNTGEAFVVNRRTGNSYPQTKPPCSHKEDTDDSRLHKSTQRRTIPQLPQAKDPDFSGGSNEKVAIPKWIQSALEVRADILMFFLSDGCLRQIKSTQ
jgi:hypothetical protein